MVDSQRAQSVTLPFWVPVSVNHSVIWLGPLLYPTREGQHPLGTPVSQVSWSHLRDSLVAIFPSVCRGSPRCSQAVSLEGQHGGYACGSQKAALQDQS